MHAHWEAAVDYFAYLARCFPVMCASDEFHFLPRAQAAGDHYDHLDNLSWSRVESAISRVKQFRDLFGRMAGPKIDLETAIDLKLLAANATGVLIELETQAIWRRNPLLYLKIAFIGLDHAMGKPAVDAAQRRHRALARLGQVPRLLDQGIDNLEMVSASDHNAAGQMAADCRRYLIETVSRFLCDDRSESTTGIDAALSALEKFRRHVELLAPVPDGDAKAGSLHTTLKDHFLSTRSLDEVFDIAVEDWHACLGALEEISRSLPGGGPWQAHYHDYRPRAVGAVDTLSLYRGEIDRLRRFFQDKGISEPAFRPPLVVAPTPAYLHSVRSSASFAAAFSLDPGEKSYFYITSGFNGGQGGADRRLQRRLHREYKFLSAHETIPGHHLLDAHRRSLDNPVRRQIESPLYYEGWAYYAESLLVEFGYVDSPLERLVDLKRSLWRAARCQIDVGLSNGRIDHSTAVNLLRTAGFSQPEAIRQIDRFRLNPGYQVCYCLGRYEILRLKRLYGAKLGISALHAAVLDGGQLPFHLIEERMGKNEVTKESA